MTAAKDSDRWTTTEARTHLGELIAGAVSAGPQTITRRGKPVVVVSAAEEARPRRPREGTLSEFFRNSPLYGSGIVIERERGGFCEIDL